MRLEGKTALVTAAGRGIGQASALAMAAEGAQVWATDVNPALLEAYAGIPNIQTAVLDVLDRQAIEALIDALPPLDVLFNCAGFVHAGSALQATDAQWDLAFNLNARAQYWTIQAALLDRINVFNDPVEARKSFVARQPIGRQAQAHGIAPLVVFLASNESAFVTGQACNIDGGITT